MRCSNGFTLIDLMIAVSIVTILTLVAVPSYQQFMRRSYRTDARATLYELAQLEERNFTTTNTYLCFNTTGVSGCTTTPTGWKNYSGNSYATRKYSIGVTSRSGTVACSGETVTNSIANSFVITATPANGFTDTECGNLTLDSCGTRGNSSGTLANCWR